MKPEMSEQQIAEQLAQSLESTSRGLAAFSRSAKPFRDALKPYQQMQIVLMQQRLWAKRHKRDDLDPLWRKIASSAEELYGVFSGFASVMSALRSIDTVAEPSEVPADKHEASAPQAPPPPAEPEEAMVNWLSQALAGFRLSPSRLAALGPPRATEAHVTKLTRAGVFEPCGRGSYRLTEGARRRLSRVLAE